MWPIDGTLSGASIQVQSRPGSDGSEGILRISQSYDITEALSSDCFVSYAGHSLGSLTPQQRCNGCIS